MQLGEGFSFRPEARHLVTTGLYSRMRNPVCVYNTIAIAAMCFAMHWDIFGIVYAVLLSAVQWRRARAEAVVLEGAFGEEYRHYRARTWV